MATHGSRTFKPHRICVREVPQLGTSRTLGSTSATWRTEVARRATSDCGQAIVEFTLILPIFLALIFIAIGYGITLNDYLRVTDIARVAARDAANARFDGQAPCQAATNAANNAAGGLTFDPPDQLSDCETPDGLQAGDRVIVTVKVKTNNPIATIPFMSLALPDELTSSATVLLQ